MESVKANGQVLCYEVTGAGRPVILLHGNGEDHHLFDAWAGDLAGAGYAVYTPDSRGHGANAPVPEYHYRDMAEDIFCFIQALGLTKPALYGHSDGGIIGLLLEISHPGTLSLLAVSGTNLSPEGLLPSFLKECEEENEAAPNPLITLMLTEPHIAPEDLKKVRIPVLVTAGEHDLVLRTETETLGRSLPNAETIILPGEDHGSYVAGSGTMGKLLIGFLEKNGYSGS